MKFNPKRMNRIAAVSGIALLVAGTLTSCAPEEGSSTAGGGDADVRIAMVPKGTNITYFDPWVAGAEDAAAEIGGEVIVSGPAEPDAAEQAQFVDTLGNQGVDGIIISANDPDSIVPSIKRATDLGSVVVTSDSDVSDGQALFVNQVTNESVADSLVEIIADKVGGKGQIAIVSGTPTAAQQKSWVDLMTAKIAKDYPDIELVETVFGQSTPETTTEVTNALLQKYPDLGGIIVPDAVSLPVAGQVVEDAGKSGEVAVTGLSLPSSTRNYVKNGTIEEFVLWDVTNLGYLSYYVTHGLATGEITAEPGEKFEAGELGEFTVTDDYQVVLGPALVFNADNIDDYDF